MTETALTYGTVLYELSVSEDMAEEASLLLERSRELREVLTSPVVSARKKDIIIEKVFKSPEFSDIMRRFLKKACNAGCIGQMKDITNRRKHLSQETHGIMDAEIYYVTLPNETQLEGIKAFLCRSCHKKDVNLHLVLNPDLIGGFVLKAGDIEYDYSLKGRLDKLTRAVAG